MRQPRKGERDSESGPLLHPFHALVFTAGIGQHASGIRERVCRGLAWLGLELDAEANAAHRTRITTLGSKVSAWVVPTDEERMIALHMAALLKV